MYTVQVIKAYREEGIELILKVLGDSLYLEKLSGLDGLKDGLEGIVELDDDESDQTIKRKYSCEIKLLPFTKSVNYLLFTS